MLRCRWCFLIGCLSISFSLLILTLLILIGFMTTDSNSKIALTKGLTDLPKVFVSS